MATTNTSEAMYRVWLNMGGSGELKEMCGGTLWTEQEARRVLPETSAVRYAFVGGAGRGESRSEGWRLEIIRDADLLAAARAERDRLSGRFLPAARQVLAATCHAMIVHIASGQSGMCWGVRPDGMLVCTVYARIEGGVPAGSTGQWTDLVCDRSAVHVTGGELPSS